MRSWREIRPEVVTDEARVAAHREKLEAEVDAYRLAEAAAGRVPEGVPKREAGVWRDPELAERIRRGIDQAEAGEGHYLGSFAQYIDDEEQQ